MFIYLDESAKKSSSSELVNYINGLKDLSKGKGASEKEIVAAEKALKLNFAEDYREYLSEFGYISFNGVELTGFSKSEYRNVVQATKNSWDLNEQVPHKMYLIEDTTIDGILVWQDSSGTIYSTRPYQKPKRAATSLLDFIQKRAK